MRATNKQSTHPRLRDSRLFGSWLLVLFSFFPSELKNQQGEKGRKGGTTGRMAKTAAAAIQYLPREGIDKESRGHHRLARPPRFHVCPIAALFRALDQFDSTALVSAPTHSLGIGSFNSVSFHLHRP